MGKSTVLVVEDEQELRSILSDTLRKNGFMTLEASNGKEGVALAREKHPDLIMLDLLMPVMGGMDALHHIRKDEWGKNVPVMILTNLSADDEHLVRELVEERPECYIIKSTWSMQDIVKKAKETLGKK